jgi:endonuclease/exonuclease/phosphatase family metal-dependent hydrolase
METAVEDQSQVEQRARPRRLRSLFLLLAGAILGGGVLLVVYGFQERAAGPAHGGGLHGEPDHRAADDGRIRVATFNIHGGKGRDGRLDLGRTAELLGDLDIIGLQEVHGADLTEESHVHQASQLARKLDMPHLFAPTEEQFGRPSFGNALLCRLPVRGWMRIPLASSSDRGKRNALLATIELNGQPLRLIVTHIDLRTDHVGQLGAVIELFRSLEPPAILMGDLNTTMASRQIRELIEDPGVSWANAAPGGKSRDWIIARGLRFVEHQTLDNGASDHKCLRATLEVIENRPVTQPGE